MLAVITGQDSSRGSTDLLRHLEPAVFDPSLKLVELLTDACHRLQAFGTLIGQTLLTFDHEDPHPLLPRGDFLNPGAGWGGFLGGRDTHGTFGPLARGLLDILADLGVAASIQSHHIALVLLAQQVQIRRRHHPAIADEDQPPDLESLLQIFQNLRHGLGIPLVATKDMMG